MIFYFFQSFLLSFFLHSTSAFTPSCSRILFPYYYSIPLGSLSFSFFSSSSFSPLFCFFLNLSFNKFLSYTLHFPFLFTFLSPPFLFLTLEYFFQSFFNIPVSFPSRLSSVFSFHSTSVFTPSCSPVFFAFLFTFV
uniref:Uncharacterized protein n=1 Tax=Cacopsylla melanoneura TaxID=428564 RepID=A0A8D8RB77_9HEMI